MIELWIEYLDKLYAAITSNDYIPAIAEWSDDAIININIALCFVIVALLIDCWFHDKR